MCYYRIQLSLSKIRRQPFTLGLDIDHLLNDGIGSYHQRLGFGFGVQRILGSRYFLNHVKCPNVEYSDFTNTDLILDYKIWLFNPTISYHSNVYNSNKLNYWLVSSFAFNVQEKRKKEPLGHLLRIGIRVELK
ncbi:hypothetical protein N8368_00585 [Bacteroidia bacterium]|nr:hypothetical protein [Bacteroidia bacterium]MDC1394985.1 hypothetical protein [Bacteroidia bacterium]